MNREFARRVADAILYEGNILFPRPSATKNRQRWSFGILYPPNYGEVKSGTERSTMHSECLLEEMEEHGQATVRIELRFLHLVKNHPDSSLESCDEGVERAVEFDVRSRCRQTLFQFSFLGVETDFQHAVEVSSPRHALFGTVSALMEQIREGVLKLSIDVRNTTPLGSQWNDRNSALLRSMLSAHIILSATGASFVSLLDPPQGLDEPAKGCANLGNFPVLVGEPGDRGMLLCSPVVLVDYPLVDCPQAAPQRQADPCDDSEGRQNSTCPRREPTTTGPRARL